MITRIREITWHLLIRIIVLYDIHRDANQIPTSKYTCISSMPSFPHCPVSYACMHNSIRTQDSYTHTQYTSPTPPTSPVNPQVFAESDESSTSMGKRNPRQSVGQPPGFEKVGDTFINEVLYDKFGDIVVLACILLPMVSYTGLSVACLWQLPADLKLVVMAGDLTMDQALVSLSQTITCPSTPTVASTP